MLLGFRAYRHYWVYYRLFFENTAVEMTHEERAHALARGGNDALYMMVQRLADENPGAERLALDALEIMHSDSVDGAGALYGLMATGSQDALNLVVYIALRARLERYQHRRLYEEYDADTVIQAVAQVASLLGNDIGINARYFFGYRGGLPEESGVIENPGYDISHTGDNLASIE